MTVIIETPSIANASSMFYSGYTYGALNVPYEPSEAYPILNASITTMLPSNQLAFVWPSLVNNPSVVSDTPGADYYTIHFMVTIWNNASDFYAWRVLALEFSPLSARYTIHACVGGM